MNTHSGGQTSIVLSPVAWLQTKIVAAKKKETHKTIRPGKRSRNIRLDGGYKLLQCYFYSGRKLRLQQWNAQGKKLMRLFSTNPIDPVWILNWLSTITFSFANRRFGSVIYSASYYRKETVAIQCAFVVWLPNQNSIICIYYPYVLLPKLYKFLWAHTTWSVIENKLIMVC